MDNSKIWLQNITYPLKLKLLITLNKILVFLQELQLKQEVVL